MHGNRTGWCNLLLLVITSQLWKNMFLVVTKGKAQLVILEIQPFVLYLTTFPKNLLLMMQTMKKSVG